MVVYGKGVGHRGSTTDDWCHLDHLGRGEVSESLLLLVKKVRPTIRLTTPVLVLRQTPTFNRSPVVDGL